MKPITFTKSFIFDSDVSRITDLIVEDDFSYELKDNDLLIRGKISGSGLAMSEIENYPFTYVVDVDCLLSLSKIDCLVDLKLSFKEHKVTLDGKLVTIVFKYVLLGNGEPYKNVLMKENKELQRELFEALKVEHTSVIEPFLDSNLKGKLEELLSEEVEIISTIDSLTPLTSFEEVGAEEEVIEIPLESSLLPEDSKEVEVEVREESEPVLEKPVMKEELFKEKYEVSYLFYKAKEDDSYVTIAHKFKCQEQALIASNQGKEVHKDVLVKVPLTK